MRRFFKALGKLSFLVFPLLLAAAVVALFWLSASLPVPSGTMRIAGLAGPVTITRDRNDVAHITGQSRADVFAGLGFVHAQERLWQMELTRMAGEGRLSEIFGAPTVDTDVFLRTLDIAGAARRSLEALSPEARAALEAYAHGVNAWIDRPGPAFGAKFSPEFVVFGHEPEPWSAADALIAIKMMSVGLAQNVGDEASRLAFAALGLSDREIDDLMPPLEGDRPPPLPDLRRLLALPPVAIGRNDERAAIERIDTGWSERRGASNNWVVSGSRTKSGLPILANDPHLGLAAPSIWYLADLRVERPGEEPRTLTGVTLPGAPFVLLGRGTSIAWGFTNTGADVQDVFVERVDPHDPKRYLTPDGWRAFDTRRETIRVAGGKDVVFTRRATRHGPVLPHDFLGLGSYLPNDTVAALGWTALASDDTTAMAGFDLWNADTVDDFKNVMRDFVTPMQSMVVADTKGSIGFVAAGRVPVRDPQNTIMGRVPVPGWLARYDWKGTIPFEDLPQAKNPPVGAIGTANAKIVGPDYKPFLTFDWEEPFRQRRIDQLIVHGPDDQTLETSRRAQADVLSLGLLAIKPRMLALVRGRGDVDRGTLAKLAAWDGRMRGDEAEPLIFLAWVRAATRDIFADDLGPAFDRWFRIRIVPLERALGSDPARDWCDEKGTRAHETCGDVLATALSQALADLATRYGPDRSAWRWGTAHMARGEHRPFSRVPGLAKLFDVEVPSPGGPFTLDRGVTNVANEDDPYGNVAAASYRGLFDLSDLDASTYIQTTGQSGNVFSPHYRDFARPWAKVEAITIQTDPAAYRKGDLGVWRLVPAD
ncbi:penicillin acylase family protein [Pararhizobium mangrovi]|uniref:Penicillin acylase family protein n=1 Tax=Pararhizobium mangrovi TaxID=2590452 RepID=A0A506UHT7_9HYPH|nr:penicillin acylase family protein [Pararhizobium mangrovi]TPW32884.1 penicillin acylase family protein [Pararhizobium mangrovi]